MTLIPLDKPFCDECGAILPAHLLCPEGLSCKCCKKMFFAKDFEDFEAETVINFNTAKKEKNNAANSQNYVDGPVEDRKCPKCGNDKMSYAAVQLKSADEDQTIFYTCTKCKFKEVEY